MELWIRSQNREYLIKCNIIAIDEVMNTYRIQSYDSNDDYAINLGHYKTKERALEVLDEIQNKMKTLLYLKPTSILTLEDIRAAKKYFEDLNDIDLIATDNNFEIEPITTNVIVYQMPEE